ncbi:MAG: ABC transporter permease [Saprospiraceae bacterium]
MLKNYLKIIRRNIAREPGYAFLNLFCLSLGIAASLLILLYVNFEANYDASHEKADRIYRVQTPQIQMTEQRRDVGWLGTNGRIGPHMQEDFPEVESMTRIFRFFDNETVNVSYDGKQIEMADTYVVDEEALSIFTFDLLHGDKKDMLSGPNKIILSKTLATDIFGDTNPVGKMLSTDLQHAALDTTHQYALEVTGVYQDLPANSHLELQALISSKTDPHYEAYDFRRFSFFTYVLLHEGTDTELLTSKIPQIYEQYMDPNRESIMKYAIHNLVPLREIYMSATGGSTYLYIFSAVGLLLLLIAIISYINMVTAQASKRSLEIGVRKVMGSSRGQLIVQFLSESMFFSVGAVLLSIAVVVFGISYVNVLLDLQLSIHQLFQPEILLGILAIVLFVGFIGGSYPAFFLSALQPVGMMKGRISKGASLRKALVAIQFGVVVFILVSTGMIYEQLKFISQKDLGFDSEQVVRLALPSSEAAEKAVIFRERVKQSPDINNVGVSSFTAGINMPRRPMSADDAENKEPQFVHFGSVDYDYFKTMNIDVVAGRNFSIEHATADAEDHVIVNESFASNFGLENPVGKRVRFGDKNNPNFITIIGIVEDFHQNSLHEPIAAQMFLLEPNAYNLSIKVNNNITKGLTHIEDTWQALFPQVPFEYQFLDDEIQRSYEVDQVRGRLFLLFSILTIFIAFIGLFGLAAYMIRQRTKEIGIRKILGATSWSIIYMVGKDFLKLVAIAAVPAFIAAWYFINGWLQDFAYRTEMNYLVFVVVLVLTLALTFLTTSLHAAKATVINPAETLKQE